MRARKKKINDPLSSLLLSPILSIATYHVGEYTDGSEEAFCLTSVDTFWPAFFFVFSLGVFFILPLLILIVLYSVIAKHLMENPGIISQGHRNNVLKYRKQVMFMLGAVVLSFFICLLPFKALTLWIIIVPYETLMSMGIEGYYNLLYFSRIMHYLNSAMNPILYNLMSSKFREGFLRLLGCKAMVRKKMTVAARKGTFHTTSTNLSSTHSDKRRDLRRTSQNQTSHESSSENGSIQRQLSFEDASGNIVRCARAILMQSSNKIDEVDEEMPTPTPEKEMYKSNVLLYHQESCEATKKSADPAVLTPLLRRADKLLTVVDIENQKNEEVSTRDQDTEYQFNLENILTAKESLV